nr:hypothetical protein [Tanacetum cinerariifolium]
MLIISPCLTDKKELASPGQMTTGKDFSNPLMDEKFKVTKVNDQEQIQALVDKTKVIITDESIRSDLRFDDAEGTACLLNEEIFKGLARMGVKTTAWNEFSITMASAILYLADNQKFNFSKYIFDNMVKSLERGVKFYLFPRFPQVFLDKQIEGMARHKEMKQRKEAETSHDESEDEDHVPTPSCDPLPSGEYSSILNELMVFYTSLQEQVLDLQEAKVVQAKKIVALKKKVTKITKWRKSRSRGLGRLKRIGSGRRVKSPMEKDGLGAQEDAYKQRRMIEEIDQNAEIALYDETQGRINDEMFGVDDLAREEVVMDSFAEPVTTVKDSAAPITDVTKDEVTMAQTLAALKSTKPKVVVQEQEMSTTIPAATIIVTLLFQLQEPKDNMQAMIDANRLLAERLQAREREEFSEVQKARLLVELIEKRKKHFSALRAQEKRNKPPTKTQMKSQMSTYLKHMGGYKQSHLKGRSFDDIKKLFNSEMRKVNDFIAMDSEA